MGIRNYPDQPRAYVDMDGVIADFEQAAIERGIPFDKAKVEPWLYRTLPRKDGAERGLRCLQQLGFDVWLLTKIPRENPYAATEKLLWVRENLPSCFHDQVIITPDKGCVGTASDILIDDHPEWANANNFPGKVIKFANWPQAIDDAVQILTTTTETTP